MVCVFRAKMSFANRHIVSHLGELHASKDETGDFSLMCHGKVIRAHSFVLCMGWVISSYIGQEEDS